MRAMTVRQPWAWAIVHGGKDVENRTQAWTYRGPLLIHAGARTSDRGMESPLYQAAYARATARQRHALDDATSAVVGVVELIDVHVAEPEIENDSGSGLWAAACCESPWAEQSYAEHGGRTRRDVVHLELADPRPLPRPIPAKGRLGLWTPDQDLVDAVLEQLVEASA